MPRKTADPSHPDIGSQELTEEIIRIRAYHLFEKRGYEHGHDQEDWLEAEAEIMGRRSTAVIEEATPSRRVRGVAA